MTYKYYIGSLLIKALSIASVYTLYFIIYNCVTEPNLTEFLMSLTYFNYFILVARFSNDSILFSYLVKNKKSRRLYQNYYLLHTFFSLAAILFLSVISGISMADSNISVIKTGFAAFAVGLITTFALKNKIDGNLNVYQFQTTFMWQFFITLLCYYFYGIIDMEIELTTLLLLSCSSLVIAFVSINLTFDKIQRFYLSLTDINFDADFFRKSLGTLVGQSLDYWTVWCIVLIYGIAGSSIVPELSIMLRISAGLVTLSYPLSIYFSRLAVDNNVTNHQLYRNLTKINIRMLWIALSLTFVILAFQNYIFGIFVDDISLIAEYFYFILMAEAINCSFGYNQSALLSIGLVRNVLLVRLASFLSVIVLSLVALTTNILVVFFAGYLIIAVFKAFAIHFTLKNALCLTE